MSALAFRSKAHWGYDAAFMEACRPSLQVTAETLSNWYVEVAETAEGIVGFFALGPDGEIEQFFVDPGAIGKGVGAVLFRQLEQAAACAAIDWLTVLSDPNARVFYEHMGMTHVRDDPSDVFGPARQLPVLVKRLRG